jgi:Predicted acyltransferases
MSSLFPESWSLTVEEWFYIFFPTMAFLTILVTQKVRLSIFSTSIFLLVAISTLRFLYVIDKDPSWDEEVRKVMVLRLDTLMYGVLGASIKYYFKDVWSKYKKPATVVGFASLAVAISCFYGFDTDTSLFSRTFLFSITSFGVMCLLPTLDSYRTTKTNNFKRAIINTSLWSYSLYLSNYLIFQVLTTITQNMNKTPYASLATLVVWVLTTFAISGAVYKWYEEPIMKMREFSIFSSAIQVLRNNANKV